MTRVGADAENAAASLRAESDTIMAQLERLRELEEKKRHVRPDDPNFVKLALDVENAARALLADAHGETERADAAHVDGVTTPIALISPDLSAVQIIEAWRDAERQLSELEPSSSEAAELRLMIDAYRRAYQSAFKSRQ